TVVPPLRRAPEAPQQQGDLRLPRLRERQLELRPREGVGGARLPGLREDLASGRGREADQILPQTAALRGDGRSSPRKTRKTRKERQKTDPTEKASPSHVLGLLSCLSCLSW